MGPLLETLKAMGATLKAADNGHLPVEIDGTILNGGEANVRPEVSSQFVSALLLAAPLMRHGLELSVEGPVPSAPYLDLTEEVLRAFGAKIERDSDCRQWRVATEALRPTSYAVEGDWSAAAFVLAAVAVAGGRVDVGSLDPTSRQGDRRVSTVLAKAGVRLEAVGDRLQVEGAARHPLEADLRNTPDLFPALAVVGSVVPGGSYLTGLDHLQHKESDRYAAMVENLQRLGARMTGDRTTLRIHSPIRSAHTDIPKVSSVGDHRIAMAMAVAALAAGPLRLDDRDCVAKSFPGFWKIWDQMIAGGRGAGAAR
jgi:3-phosphoshikimate 1-carboxyvinyltransferase